MSINYPGPYQLRVFYTVSGRSHLFNLNFKVAGSIASGENYNNIFPITRDGSSSVNLTLQESALIAALDNWFNTGDADFTRSEVWSYPPLSFDGTFVTGHDIGISGASASATVPASEIVVTMRTQEGGVMRFHVLDTRVAPALSVSPPYTVDNLNVSDALMGDGRPWLGRDTSYPISAIKIHPGQNERLFKQIYR